MSKTGLWTRPKSQTRRCAIYDCGYVEFNLCCADCAKEDCKNRCQNTPEKCGQTVQKKKKMKIHKESREKPEEDDFKMTIFPGERLDKFIVE